MTGYVATLSCLPEGVQTSAREAPARGAGKTGSSPQVKRRKPLSGESTNDDSLRAAFGNACVRLPRGTAIS